MPEEQSKNTGTARTVATFTLALSLFALAGAVIYFSLVVGSYRNEIPEILASIEQTTSKIEPVVEEVGKIRDTIPPILDEVARVRKQIPPILDEVAQVRKQIPAVLQEVRQTREQVPLLLKEVERTRQDLPQVLASADKASAAITVAAKEVQATRPLVPKILAEVKTTRESIPPMLDKADVMIDKARRAGREASSGAVTGIFTGILTAPFALVGSVGESLGMTRSQAREYSDQDMAMLKKTSEAVLAMTEVGAFKEWHNPDSGFHGKITLQSIDKSATEDCRSIFVQAWKKKKLKHESTSRVCLDEEGKWVVEK